MGQDDPQGLRRAEGGGRGLTELAYWVPGPAVAVQAVLAGLAIGVLAAGLAAWMRARGMRVPYTRKIFHFAIFTGAAVVHTHWGLPGTIVYGVTVALMVLAAVAAGDGNPLYEALGRDTDRPRRSLFIVVPLVMTAIGGLASAVLAGPYASVGYLVAGWGDAVGEPVGSRWGRHRYRVPSLAGVPAERSLEGSAAVFFAAWLASAVALWGIGVGQGLVPVALACAVAGAATEAASNHGLDNLTVQVVSSLVAVWLVG
jgi:phytol kinase